MKTLRNISLIVAFVLNSQLVLSQWELTYKSESLVTVGHGDCSFSSPENGWAAYVYYGSPSGDDYLAISYTNDFGVTWTEQTGMYSTSLGVTDISTSDSNNIYCTGNYPTDGFCRYSHDAGVQWTTLSFGMTNYTTDAFLLSNNTLFITTQQNYLDYNNAKLFKFSQDSLCTLIDTDSLNFTNSNIFFLTSNTGYITAKDSLNNNVILFTNNGGDNFVANIASAEYLYREIYFTSDSVGYICCSEGKILKTLNYGVSFVELITPTTNDLMDIQFINDSSGYCVGKSGTCIYTSDYGITWTYDSINTTNYLKKIQMFSMEYGYILGGSENSGNSFEIWTKNNMASISIPQKEIVNIYPNPTTDYLNINCNQNIIIDEISIYNTLGEKIFYNKTNERVVNISNFDQGIYIVIFKIENLEYVTKIIKQ